ncbi:MAG: AMP-binding protein [Promethearchaeota archaeon]
MKKGKGRILSKKSGNRNYRSYWMYIPSKIAKDRSFPFSDKEEVSLELKGTKLIVKKRYDLHEIIKKYGFSDATLPNILETKAKLNNSLPLFYFQDKTFTYEETNKISNRIANGILKLIEDLDLSNPKIAVMFPNCPAYIFCWFGIAKTASIFVGINYLLQAELLEYFLNNSDTELLFIDHMFLSKFNEISHKLPKIKKVIVRNTPEDFNYNNKFMNYEEVLSKNVKNPNITINHFEPLEILYTSGVTGMPKGVLYKNFYTLSGISMGASLESVGINHPGHKIYNPMYLFQSFPRYSVIIPAIYYNASFIIAEKFDITSFWKDIDKYKPSGFSYYGAHLSEIVNQQPSEKDRNHSVKYAFGAGAIKKVWETFERRFGIRIIESWSIGEGVGVTINTVGSRAGKIGSVGKPAKGFQLKIVDSNGNELPPGRDNVGEITTRMTLPFELEYYNGNGNIIDLNNKDRWFRTGDYGYKDIEGFIYFLGTKDDMISKGNEFFFALDIELIANSHPLIIESAAFEVQANGSSKSAIKLCAVIKKDASISYESLHEYFKENLAYYMVPRYYEFKEELPKNTNGLVQKYILKEEWKNKKLHKNVYDIYSNDYLMT